MSRFLSSPQNCDHSSGTSRERSGGGGRSEGRNQEIQVSRVVTVFPQKTVPLARASASPRNRTGVSDACRSSHFTRKAHFRELINQGRSGPGPGPAGPDQDDRAVGIAEPCNGRARGRPEIVSLATLDGSEPRKCCLAGRNCALGEGNLAPAELDFRAVPPVINNESTTRHSGRSTRIERKGKSGLMGAAASRPNETE